MKSICPFCHRSVVYTINNNIFCKQSDHEFWQGSINNWFIHHIPTDLFIDDSNLSYNYNPNISLITFNRITPEEAAGYLLKAIKLHVFS